VRGVRIFNDQLYGSSGNGPFTNVFSIGSGIPETANQTATSLPGMPTTGASPFSFVMFDLAASPAGLDTMYVADSAAGVQKWTFNGTTWSLVATLNITGNAGFRHIGGFVTAASGGSPQAVTLMAATAETTNRLVTFVDTGVGTPASQVVATAGANTIFRGIALSPHFPAP
jgi:hypothetical protein